MDPRVLVCVDDLSLARSLARRLRVAGFDVLTCRDGRTATARINDWRPAFAVIDIALPDMPGHAVAQQIRAEPHGTETTLIALTASDGPGDVGMARHAGFDWLLAKPADDDALIAVLHDPANATTNPGAVKLR